MRFELIAKLLKEYKADPNCWPALWIKGEGLSVDEEKYFVCEASKIK